MNTGADDHRRHQIRLTAMKSWLVTLLLSRRFRVEFNQYEIQKSCIFLLLLSDPCELSIDSIPFLVPRHMYFSALYVGTLEDI